MSGKSAPTLDKAKVLKNAVTSIQLGIEDYQLTQGKRGNPLRAVSAARNLFAGLLLLFKYKISTLADSPEHAASLIYKARKFKPCRTDGGMIEWRPELERNKTIDVADIQLHLKGWEFGQTGKRLTLCKRAGTILNTFIQNTRWKTSTSSCLAFSRS